MDAPVVDGAVCEQIFCVRRRRAVELMQLRWISIRQYDPARPADLIIHRQALDARYDVGHER
jgi:hypothetical protein